MKMKITIDVDTKTGLYKINFGKTKKTDVDYKEIMNILYKILLDVGDTIQEESEDRTIH